MTKYIISLAVLLAILGGLYHFDDTSPALSSKEALEKGLSQLKQSADVSKDQENYLKIQLAIADFIARNAEPPDSLEALVPKYFDAVPVNPSTGKQYSYIKKGKEFKLLDVSKQKTPPKRADKKGSSVEKEFVNPNTVIIEEFAYDPSGKRDPFMPFDFAPKRVIDESLPPLERYDISELRTAAILTDSKGEKFALIEDGNGRGHSVRIGDKVGNKNGEVVSIDEKEVNVLESVTDFTGTTTKNLVSLPLNAPKKKATDKRRR